VEDVPPEAAPAAARGGPPARAETPLEEDVEERFVTTARDAGCQVIRCQAARLPEDVAEFLRREGIGELLCWDDLSAEWSRLTGRLRDDGVRLDVPDLSTSDTTTRADRLAKSAAAVAGLTGATAGLADAGSVIVASGAGRSQLASLLPPIHLVVLRSADICAGLEDWLGGAGRSWVDSQSDIVLITGPSRTADIEMTLTIGVHGPGRVVIFLVGARSGL
jgi:L-lactate dehydrogenase complex protein LldG